MTASGRPADHDRARRLAAEAIDFPLEPADDAWLSGHLAGCAECSTIAAEHRLLHDELRSLVMPEPPRDLWARTAAAFDEIDGRAAPRHRTAASFFGGLSFSMMGSAIAVGAVVLVVAASITSQGVPGQKNPAASEIAFGSPSPTGRASLQPVADTVERPLGVSDGQVYYAIETNGRTTITTSAACLGTQQTCTVEDVKGNTVLNLTDPNATVAAVNSAGNRVVVMTGSTLDIVAVQAQASSSPAPSASPSATQTMASFSPSPSTIASASPRVTPRVSATPERSAANSPTPTVLPATPSPTPSSATSPTAPVSPTPVASPTITASPSGTPTATATLSGTILAGYQVVGPASFSPDGTWLAFSAQSLDGTTGPDLFVWRDGLPTAVQLTNGHAAYFAGWSGGQILFTQFEPAGGIAGPADSAAPSAVPAASSSDARAASVPISYMIDPGTRTGERFERPMLLPSIDPTLRYIVYWSGAVSFDATTHLWSAQSGDLYFDLTSNVKRTSVSFATGSAVAVPGPSASASASASSTAAPATPAPTSTPIATATSSSAPSAGPSATPLRPQLLPIVQAAGAVQNWQVRWDATGRALVVWVGDSAASETGELAVFAIDDTLGIANTEEALIKAATSASFQVAADRVIYTTTSADGQTKTFFVKLPQVSLPAATPTPGSVPSASIDDTTKGGGH